MEMLAISRPLLAGASALNASASVNLEGAAREIMVYVRFSAGVLSGAVAVETAYSEDETAQWSNIATVTAAANQVVHVRVQGAIRALRTRISTAIAGGTVDTWVVAN